jgi:hypothetical protein
MWFEGGFSGHVKTFKITTTSLSSQPQPATNESLINVAGAKRIVTLHSQVM